MQSIFFFEKRQQHPGKLINQVSSETGYQLASSNQWMPLKFKLPVKGLQVYTTICGEKTTNYVDAWGLRLSMNDQHVCRL